MKTLKYAWRFLIRSKSYTIINLLGLASVWHVALFYSAIFTGN